MSHVAMDKHWDSRVVAQFAEGSCNASPNAKLAIQNQEATSRWEAIPDGPTQES